MPLNNEYKRYFIILQEDDKGYEMAAGKIPTGYVKIEIKNGKGKLTAYVQNIKFSDKVDYKMLLISPAKKSAVDMGRIMMDGSGRGELNVEFDADNVLRSGMEISDFMVAAMLSNTSIPLSGYTGRDKVQWKNSYQIVNRPAERIDKKQQKLEEVVTPVQLKPMEAAQPIQTIIPETTMAPMENPVGIVADFKNVVGIVVEGAKEVVENAVENVVENVVEKVVVGAKNIAGDITQGIKNVVEFVIEDDEVKPAPVVPIVEPIIMAPMKPMFEVETEIKAKFVIEEQEYHQNKPYPKCEIQCPEIDYKNFYYEEECESDSDCDCDSDSDDREKDHHHDGHMHPFYESPMYRRLEKVMGRLRAYEPFEDDDSREKWYRVEDDIYLLNSATIPFMGAMMPLGYPYMSNECVMTMGRKDYIIGVKHEKGKNDKRYIKSVMFGIPGRYSAQEEKHYRMRGFNQFRRHKSRERGYWVMTVAIGTGEIMMK